MKQRQAPELAELENGCVTTDTFDQLTGDIEGLCKTWEPNEFAPLGHQGNLLQVEKKDSHYNIRIFDPKLLLIATVCIENGKLAPSPMQQNFGEQTHLRGGSLQSSWIEKKQLGKDREARTTMYRFLLELREAMAKNNRRLLNEKVEGPRRRARVLALQYLDLTR